MRVVLSISEKAARALRVAAAEQGYRGVSALIDAMYGIDPPPVHVHRSSDLAGWLEKLERKVADNEQKIVREYTVDERDKIWETIKRLGLVPSEHGPAVPPFVGDPEQLVVALDCGFGPSRTAHDEFRHDGQTETLVRVADPIVQEEGTLGEGHE